MAAIIKCRNWIFEEIFMKADAIPLLGKFLSEKQQCIIPIYQRKYSWTIKQCRKLWEDIKELSVNDNIEEHFLGTIVNIQEDRHAEIAKRIIIDGQQRITTMILLIIAMSKNQISEARKDILRDDFLINTHEDGNLRYKLSLTQQDYESLINLIEGREEIKSKRLLENFNYFKDILKEEDLDEIYKAMRKIMIVNIELDPKCDNPQLIFESLNSTGMALSQADLIRNYILMGLESKLQERLFLNYWQPMEKDFGQESYSIYFDRFIRDYITLKTGSIPTIMEI